MFYDVTFNSWAQGNGVGGGAGGGFSYTRTTVEGGLEPPEPEFFYNYELTISDVESYQNGTESMLPNLDVDGGGIVIKAALKHLLTMKGHTLALLEFTGMLISMGCLMMKIIILLMSSWMTMMIWMMDLEVEIMMAKKMQTLLRCMIMVLTTLMMP